MALPSSERTVVSSLMPGDELLQFKDEATLLEEQALRTAPQPAVAEPAKIAPQPKAPKALEVVKAPAAEDVKAPEIVKAPEVALVSRPLSASARHRRRRLGITPRARRARPNVPSAIARASRPRSASTSCVRRSTRSSKRSATASRSPERDPQFMSARALRSRRRARQRPCCP